MTSQVAAGSAGPESGEQPADRLSGPVDQWFGPSAANFLVAHRARLQSMPLSWQRQFARLFDDFRAAFADEADPDFYVITVAERCVEELSDADMRLLGITVTCTEQDDGGRAQCFTDRMGNELDGEFRVAVPIADPIPGHRGAFLPPDEDAIAAARAGRLAPAGAGPGDWASLEATWREDSTRRLKDHPPGR